MNWKKILFWANLIAQVGITIAVFKNGTVYKEAYMYAQFGLVIMLISANRALTVAQGWKEKYDDLLEEQIEEVK